MHAVGFFASLQPKQNAYTKMALSKTAEFRLHVKRVEYRLVRGYLYPNLYYIMTVMPLPTQNILRIFWAVGHFTGWNVQIVYSIRFVLGTLSRRSSATFGSVPDLRVPSWFFKNLRTFGASGWLRALQSFGFIRRPSAALLDLRLVGQPPGTGVCQYLRLPSCDLGQPPVHEVMIPNNKWVKG